MDPYQQVIEMLEAADGPARPLDWRIAMVVGYQKTMQNVRDPRSGQLIQRTFWVYPGSGEVGLAPEFTGDLDAAYDLLHQVAPNNIGAFSWENGRATAQLWNGRRCYAATPAIALCIAALTYLKDGGHLND